MASKDIKLNPDEVLGHVNRIAATMAEVSVPGPVPLPGPTTSPIDVALNAVAAAAAEKAEASSRALSTRGSVHNFQSVKAIETMQAQEDENLAKVNELQTDIAEANSWQT
ncbi:hypothetical protein DVS77_25020 [Mycolicibacterium moriokaense]|nr:hypothetical protein DVS77_25020 [Mycolicibacterium moriokaense]